MTGSKWLFPRSHRFCLNCLRETVFIYSEKEDHSVCKVCQKTGALNPNNRRVINVLHQVYKRGYIDGLNKAPPIFSIGDHCAACKKPAGSLFLINGRWYCIDCCKEVENGLHHPK